MTRRVMGPFNRVEGDLEVQLDIADGRVRNAWVTSPLYRGFERMLVGKDPRDALVYAPRICGICSVSQSVAAATALADAQGVSTPPNGELATNLILACENLTDHLTHFYLFFMPDFAHATYATEAWYDAAAARFKAVQGSATREMLKARAEFLHLMGLLAGKWPHSLALQPGGTTRALEAQEISKLLAILYGFRRFLEERLFGAPLERIAELHSTDQLNAYMTEAAVDSGDLRHFLHIAAELNLDTMGRAADRFMSYGSYRRAGLPVLKRGVWDGAAHALDEAKIREDISHSWLLDGEESPLHPYEGETHPDTAMADGYTWCKAPRLDGQAMEVGALARQVVDGQPLARELVAQSGGNVRNRVVARLLELARIVPIMEDWARAISPGEPFCNTTSLPQEASGVGMVEAARGSLGHWLVIKNGRIHNYQIVAPTTWNFSPRDAKEQPGSLEQALIDAPVRPGEREPVSVQHIVRSFDPCMVCTVH